MLDHSLTRNRALMRGRSRDDVTHIPLTSTVTESSACSPPFPEFAHINVQSCGNKTVQIHDFIEDNDFDVLFLTETLSR